MTNTSFVKPGHRLDLDLPSDTGRGAEPALRSAFAEEAVASARRLDVLRGSGDAAALVAAQLNYLKARDGAAWLKDDEARERRRLERLSKQHDRAAILLGRHPGSRELEIVTDVAGGVSPWPGALETRQQRFDQINLDPRFLGTFNYSSWSLGGAGRVRQQYGLGSRDGRMGGTVDLSNRDADDADVFEGMAEGGILVGYVPTFSGQVRMVATFQCESDNCFRFLYNEWGDSSCFLSQQTTFEFGAWSDGPVARAFYGPYYRFYASYIGNGSVNYGGYAPNVRSFAMAIPGDTIMLTGAPPLTVTQGNHVTLLVGCRVLIGGWLNDVGATICQSSVWRLKSLSIGPH